MSYETDKTIWKENVLCGKTDKMNLVIDATISPLRAENVYFTEKKKNIIIDGVFAKLVYSTEYMALNGLFVFFPVVLKNQKNLHSANSRSYMEVDNVPQNTKLFDTVCKLEDDILQQYKTSMGVKHTCSHTLKNQLLSGFIKIQQEFADNMSMGNGSLHSKPDSALSQIVRETLSEPIQCVLKISGIWETTTHIGITFKFVTMRKSETK